MTTLNLSAATRAEDNSAAATVTRTVLVVDDSPMDQHLAGSIVEKIGGWRPLFAGNGIEALALLEKETPAAVLTDLLMPEMDGLELVQAIHTNYPLVPVILMTAHGSEDIAIQALRKGAASYVPKKSLARDLADTFDQILAASRTRLNERRILESLTQLEHHYVVENDLTLVAPLVGHLEEQARNLHLCGPSGLILLGVALHEALTNAILHGNLELDSSLRENEDKRYYDLARSRREAKPYCDRRVHVTARLTPEQAEFIVCDEGKGFDPQLLPDPTDPANLERVSGRGLLLIQTFMDNVSHNEVGNEIRMIKRRTA